MSSATWLSHLWNGVRGINPFGGNCLPGRVRFFATGRPSLPFPTLWNFREPLSIMETFFHEADRDSGSARHSRYLYGGGFPPVLVTRDPAVIKAVLLSTGDKPGQFDRDTAPAQGIGKATGRDTLLYANGPEWRRQKKLVAKPFSKGTIFQPEEFHEFEVTFRNTITQRLEALRLRQERSGEKVVRIALEPEIQTVMLEMLINNAFGGHIPYEELRCRYIPAMVGLIDNMIVDTIAPRLNTVFGVLAGRRSRLRRWRADFEAITDIALAGRQGGLGLWGEFKSESPDEKLRGNIRVFLAGALEATTSFAGWAVTHLSRTPELQEQIYDEVKDMESYNPENLTQAQTLNRVMNETLRLTPSLYFLPRRATVETSLEISENRTMSIPAGTHIILDIWHANRMEEFWGVEKTGFPAEEFHPNRWDNIAPEQKRDFLHFGFGHGPRVCPGQFLGQLEVGLVVGALVKVFRFKAAHATTNPKAGVSTKPEGGVLVDLELRNPQ